MNYVVWPLNGYPHEKPGQTLQATALVHEAYVRRSSVLEI
jgi:hypothetical protein